MNCQTDFVSRGDEFRTSSHERDGAGQEAPKGADLSALTVPGTDKTLDVARQEMVAKTGENIVVRRWARVEAKGAFGLVYAYVHMGGKMAVLLSADAPNEARAEEPHFKAFVENCAMQVCGDEAEAVQKEEIPEGDRQAEEIFAAQFKEEQDALPKEKQKPEAIWPKIIDGKVAKWLDEITLLGQDNV